MNVVAAEYLWDTAMFLIINYTNKTGGVTFNGQNRRC